MDKQERLDKGADALWKLIQDAQKGAAEACSAGDNDTSSKLYIMAGLMQISYGLGRTLNMGGIQPRAGGK